MTFPANYISAIFHFGDFLANIFFHIRRPVFQWNE
jgi:hypothetical protein